MSAVTVLACLTVLIARQGDGGESFVLNDLEYYETRWAYVLVFSNRCNDMFSDSKMGGIEIIHHGVRTATNGDVSLSPTPEQWDPVPQVVERRVDRGARAVDVFLRYPANDFAYRVRAEAREGGVVFSVDLDRPLPRSGSFRVSEWSRRRSRTGAIGRIFPLSPAESFRGL